MNKIKRPASRIRFAFAGILFLLSIHPATPARADEAYDRCVEIFQIGMTAEKRADYQTAIDKYKETRDCLLEISGGEETQDTATLIDNIGTIYNYLGDYERALEFYNKVLKIQLSILGEQHPDTALSYGNIGSVLYSLGDYERALEFYDKALEIFQKTLGEKNQYTATCYNNIGNVYNSLGDYKSALEYYNKALEIRLSILGEQHPDTANSYNGIGNVYDSLGDYERALEFFNKALEIFQKTFGEKNRYTAKSYKDIGDVYYSLGDYERALEYYNKALEIQLSILGEQHLDTANSYNSIGGVYYSLGDYEHALEFHNKALELVRKTLGDEHQYTATCYNNIGNVYNSLGDYERALEFFNKALEIRLSILGEQHPDTATSYDSIGNVYNSLRDYERALEFYNKALEIRLSILGEQHPDTALSYNNIGVVYNSLGDHEHALEFFNKALEIRLSILGEQHPDTAYSYTAIGNGYNSLGDFDRALEFYNKALEIILSIFGEQHPDTAYSYTVIGLVYYFLGDHDREMEFYQSALGSMCGGAGNHEVDNCRPEIGTLDAFQFIADTARKAGDPASAATAYENAAAALERLRGNIKSEGSKTFHGGKYYDMFPEGIGAFVSLHDETGDIKALERGFMFAERGIGRVFLEQLGRSRAQVDGGLPDDVIEEGLTLEARRQVALDNLDKVLGKPKDEQSQPARAGAYNALNEAQAALDDYDTRLRDKYPEYAALMNPQPHTLADIRDVVLAPGEAALEYYLGPEASWLIFITKDNIRIVELPKGENIENLVSNYRNNLKNSYATIDNLDEGKLYDILIGPVENDLAGITKLLIVPTGMLNFLPFEALNKGDKYLVETFDIRYAPSLNVAYMAADRAGKRQGQWGGGRQWAGFGDPIYGGAEDERVEIKPDGTAVALSTGAELSRGADDLLQRYGAAQGSEVLCECRVCGKEESVRYKAPMKLCRLCATGEEITDIAAQFGYAADSANVHLGLDVNEATLREAADTGYRFIHVSTHGTMGIDKDQCLPPALFLSTMSTMNKAHAESRSLCFDKPDPDDGVLTMIEVFNMKVPVEMVVLSACETGQGKLEKGEGVAGMSRAFLYAGADSLVVSLWSVADAETKDLMVSFYTKILAGEDRQTALTDTKREFIEKGLSPYYWAPFIYIGVN